MAANNQKIAYFSMEIGFNPEIPIYSGGLGILAGDTLQSAADKGVPVVAFTLMYRNGYFDQKLINGEQTESNPIYNPRRHFEKLDIIKIPFEGGHINLTGWRHDLKGENGTVPIIALDAHSYVMNGGIMTPLNPGWQEALTAKLYDSEHEFRKVAQRYILGRGGIKMMHHLGYTPEVIHFNEGHAGFGSLELMKEYGSDKARDMTVFTNHTPVAAGNDKFDYDIVRNIMPKLLPENIEDLAGSDRLNMTQLLMNRSAYRNGVAEKHGEVLRDMFPGYDIDSITNGVHHITWTSASFRELYDKHLPGWREDPSLLSDAKSIPLSEIVEAHYKNKSKLIDCINNTTDANFDPDILTIGFARRFATYKRGNLFLQDPNRYMELADNHLQLVLAGKAHPNDGGGKGIIKHIYDWAHENKDKVRVTILENYDIELGKLMTAGSDIWQNNPRVPMEASGTSGMKAALNGVPHLSTADGWWLEAEGGGWTINGQLDPHILNSLDEATRIKIIDAVDANDLYGKLNAAIIPAFKDAHIFQEVQRQAIANGAVFNSHRMVDEYVEKAYSPILEDRLDNVA